MKVGIIVGRFQVDELHEGHRHLIDTTIYNMDKVFIFLGETKDESITKRNPLPFEARRDMILEIYPDLQSNIFKIHDIGNWKLWVEELDRRIISLVEQLNIKEESDIFIVGSRDSVATKYKEFNGIFNVFLVDELEGKSGTQTRAQLSLEKEPIWTKDMRKHFIWIINNKKINNDDSI